MAGYAYTSLHSHGFSIVLGVWLIQVLLIGTFWDFFPPKYFQSIVGWIRRCETHRYGVPTVFIYWYFYIYWLRYTLVTSLLFWGLCSSSPWQLLLATQEDSHSADGCHPQIWAVLVLVNRMHDAAQGGLGVLVDGGPCMGGGVRLLAGSSHHYH